MVLLAVSVRTHSRQFSLIFVHANCGAILPFFKRVRHGGLKCTRENQRPSVRLEVRGLVRYIVEKLIM
jgi:hypothetical protein